VGQDGILRAIANRPCSVVNGAEWPIANRPRITNPPHIRPPALSKIG
jgi:hypothetical protein